MLLSGFRKFLYLVSLQKKLDRTEILCMSDGKEDALLTHQSYLAK
jgi:hypothetical protein